MKRLLVSLEEETYEAIRRLAFERNTQMAKLVRDAIEQTYEDELDGIIGEMRLKQHLADPTGSVSLEEYMKEQGIALPDRHRAGRTARARRAAG